VNRGYLYILLAALSAVIALFLSSWFQWLFVWIALAAVYFAAGYISGYGEVLMKSENGRVPVYLKTLLLPILIGVTIYNIIARKMDKQPAMQRIRPGLWLGRRLTLTEQNLLEENGITAVLDVTAEFDSPGSWFLPRNINYFNVPVFDRSEPRRSQLVRAIQWVDRQRDQGREVLIHCALGQGRSVTMLIAYLLHIEPDASVDGLLQSVKDIRDSASPNKRQLKVLHKAHEEGLLAQKIKLCVIINPVSGSRPVEEDLEQLDEMLDPFVDYWVLKTSAEHSAAQLTRQAIDEGATTVVAAGGDGTVMEVASVVAGTDVALGILPRGTANALAVCLYGQSIRFDPVSISCQHILAGTYKRIDVVEVNEKNTMVLLAGVGMEAGMVERAERELKTRWGVLAYLIGGWQQLESQKLFQLKLSVDGKSYEYETGSVTVANAAPNTSVFAQGGGVPAMDDGQADITVITDVKDRADAVEVMSDLFFGVLHEKRDFERDKIKHFRGREIVLDTEPKQKVVVDGELLGETPIRLVVKPSALRVVLNEDV